MSKNLESSVHITINLVINNDAGWEYTSPRVEKSFGLSIPIDFFNETIIARYIGDKIKEMEKEFPQAVAKHEAEKAKEQEA